MKKFIHEFKEFALRGNVVDLAVGIIIGAGFNKIVDSLVKDIILPPIGLILKRVDFSTMYLSLNGEGYDSLQAAQQAGAPTLNYGLFINNLISFTITALVVFILVKKMNALRRKHDTKPEPTPTTKQCPFCKSVINIEATRCPQCTSELK